VPGVRAGPEGGSGIPATWPMPSGRWSPRTCPLSGRGGGAGPDLAASADHRGDHV